MRTVKLQVQISVDGFVARPAGEMDWMTWNFDPALAQYINDLTDTVDTMLTGRVLYQGFAPHWESIPEGDPQYPFAQKMNALKKIVFSRTLKSLEWGNSELAKGSMEETVAHVKQQPGKDIIVYGGASTVAWLLEKGLIDELFLFVNPAALGRGLPIFECYQKFRLIEARGFACGIALLHYARA
ncbi:dihydrofolate reductase family protein [Dinghuibacter silviterrae]|uniref:Dihydrofolate reductase n=1 Tax=Dinghuibacter silviterrae TaxID=1539049 RepID=A0A4V3GM11_9BACT|nr:dihydrofolate reductase family protein [Dinghuibacter silviterrae]TDX01623.1 dihydrofolate reductase [Dinghuibacter silviterrae]